MTNFFDLHWALLILIVSFTAFSISANKLVIMKDHVYQNPVDNITEIVDIQILDLPNITSIYCEKLPNIRKFKAKAQSIFVIDANAFKNCSKLTHLNLNFNKIQRIHPNTFDHNPNLQYVTFFQNKLEEIPSFNTI